MMEMHCFTPTTDSGYAVCDQVIALLCLRNNFHYMKVTHYYGALALKFSQTLVLCLKQGMPEEIIC